MLNFFKLLRRDFMITKKIPVTVSINERVLEKARKEAKSNSWSLSFCINKKLESLYMKGDKNGK